MTITTTALAPQTVCAHFGIHYSPFTDTFPMLDPFATGGETHLKERIGSLLGRLRKPVSRKEDAPYTVIVLDEAHTMPGEALLEIFSLTQDADKRTASASIVLCGHPMLEKTLALDIHAAIKTRIAARLSLRPLQGDEMDAFIRFRLKTVKASPNPFSKEAIKLIELDSKGNRRVIMNLAGNRMDLAVIRQEELVTDELAREVCDQA